MDNQQQFDPNQSPTKKSIQKEATGLNNLVNAFTVNRIDSITENYTNPLDAHMRDPNVVGEGLENSDPDQPVLLSTLENIEEFFMEQSGVRQSEEKLGILDEIICR